MVGIFQTIAIAGRPKSANKARAVLCLAICHLQLFHPEINKPEALRLLIATAQQSDGIAQSYIKRLHDACQIKLAPKLPIAEWLNNASERGLSTAWMDLQGLDGHKDVLFRPYRVNGEAFSSPRLHDQNQLKKSVSSIGSTQIFSLTTSDGESVLHYAAAAGMYEVISAIGKSGHSVDCKNRKNMTPLHLACWNGQHSAFRVLLSFKADANSLASNNITPLHLAVASLDFASVKILLNANGNLHIQSFSNPEEVTGR